MRIENRKIIYLFQAPIYYLYKFLPDLDLSIYKKVYGMTYSFYPALIMGITCIVNRKNTQRLYWAIISLSLGFLAFQFIYLSEHLIACQLYVVILSIVDVKKLRWFSVILIAVLLICHPVGVYLLGFHVCVLLFLRIKGQKDFFLSDIVIFSLFVLRLYMFFQTTEEIARFEGNGIIRELNLHVKGFLAHRDVLFSMFFIGLALVISLLKRSKLSSLFFVLYILTFFGWLLFVDQVYMRMLSYRYLIFLLATPFYIGIVLSIFLPDKDLTHLKKIAILSALTFLTTLSVQGYLYKRDVGAMIEIVDKFDCTDSEVMSLNYKKRAWNHWTINFEYILNKEIRDVDKLIANERDCRFVNSKKEVVENFPMYIKKSYFYNDSFFKFNIRE